MMWKSNRLLARIIASITRNACLGELRRGKKIVSVGDEQGARGFEVTLWFDPADKVAEIEYEASLQVVQELLRDYSKEPRGTVARLYYERGMNTREIAEATSMPQNTILSHLHKFRRELKAALLAMQAAEA